MHYNLANASGKRTNEGFVVLRGSTITSSNTNSCPEGTLRARRKYANIIDSNYTLLEDILFTSPSAAARFVGGASLSGNTQWKTNDGRTLGQIERE